MQAAGKVRLDAGALGVDFLTLSAHKLGGPQGVGALVLGPGIEPAALLRGGSQERRWRAGTENLPGIAGFGRAAELALEDTGFAARTAALRDRLEAEIRKVAPGARVYGAAAPRLPTTSCLAMPGVGNQTQLIALDLAGIHVSTGSACSSGKVGPSHVLAAMGVAPAEAASAIRVSLGWASTDADVDRFIAAWTGLYTQAGRAAATRALASLPPGRAIVPGPQSGSAAVAVSRRPGCRGRKAMSREPASDEADDERWLWEGWPWSADVRARP